MSGTGSAHIALVSVSSLSSIAAMVLAGVWLTADRRLKGYGRFSYAMAALTVASGVASAVAIRSRAAGLLERITIGAFVLWMFMLAVEMYRTERVAEAAGLAGLVSDGRMT